jgi:hypothetical protein
MASGRNRTKRLFAVGTTVEIPKTRSEIEALLTKHGATSFASGWEGTRARILFEAHGRRVRFSLDLLDGETSKEIAENRRRWRCLLLVLKAKLEAVANNLVTFEEEFLAHIMLPDGSGETIGDWVSPQLAAAYERGVNMPPLLGAGEGV